MNYLKDGYFVWLITLVQFDKLHFCPLSGRSKSGEIRWIFAPRFLSKFLIQC